MKTDSFLEVVTATVAERGMLHGGERVLLAVSGGADSLSMLHAMADLAASLHIEPGVAHFDHRLREDSGADADFVRAEAGRLGLPFHLGVADDTAPLKGASHEESARNRRRDFLAYTARDEGYDRTATAHTLDDQAETVLMHVLLGAGRRGLSGIPPVRWKMIRPLIDLRRADTEAFCAARGLTPRMDPTNNDRSFLRNSIRHEALPFLRERYNERLPEALARMADITRAEDYLLDQIASAQGKPVPLDDGMAVSLENLRSMNVAAQRRMIRLLARVAGPGISAAHIERVRRLALGAGEGKSLDLPGSIQARIQGGTVVVGPAVAPPDPLPEAVLDVPGETELAGWGLTVRAFISTERPDGLPDGGSACVLDADRCALPLRIRPARTGDRFKPLGMTGVKKVGDFFTDRKVPVGERSRVPVVVDASGRIVWIVGHAIDHDARLSEGTGSVLHLQVEER